jgi:hypothetical protein
MLYILRLTNGNCLVVLAANEPAARRIAGKVTLDSAGDVVTVRRLQDFAVLLCPTQDGSLDVSQWDDTTLDNVLATEYPSLNEAYRAANSQCFEKPSGAPASNLEALNSWHEKNLGIIRQGIEIERKKFNANRKKFRLARPRQSPLAPAPDFANYRSCLRAPRNLAHSRHRNRCRISLRELPLMPVRIDRRHVARPVQFRNLLARKIPTLRR